MTRLASLLRHGRRQRGEVSQRAGSDASSRTVVSVGSAVCDALVGPDGSDNGPFPDRHAVWHKHVGPDAEVATMVSSQGSEDLDIGVQSWLGPGHHGAADARLSGHQRDGADLQSLPDPVVLEPALAVDVDQRVGSEASRIPDAIRV